MRLAGALTLAMDAPPRLSVYARRAYGGCLALEISSASDEGLMLAGLTLFAPMRCEEALRRAVAAFNAEMDKKEAQPNCGCADSSTLQGRSFT